MDDSLVAHLVCPRCRGVGRSPPRLAMRKSSLACRRCGARYPVRDGVPVVMPDAEWVEPAANVPMIENYVWSHYPERCASKRLTRRLAVNERTRVWIREALSRQDVPCGTALELGCGPGAWGDVWIGVSAYAILCDIRSEFAACARAHWQRPDVGVLLCDAHDPPFRGQSMSLVAAVNLLDATPEPWLLLGQMDALLKAGGVMVLTMPFVANFSGPDDVFSALRGERAELPHLSYNVLEAKDWLPWVVPAGERLVHEYRVHALLARKNG